MRKSWEGLRGKSKQWYEEYREPHREKVAGRRERKQDDLKRDRVGMRKVIFNKYGTQYEMYEI